MRCPICRSPMGYRESLAGGRLVEDTIDCLAGHRASTDPEFYELARVRELTREIREYLDDAPTCIDEQHQWIQAAPPTQDTGAVLECLRCHCWAITPPGEAK
jgi:hypothetical protein